MLVYVLREAKGTPTYSTKQKQDNSNKPSNTTDNRTTENSLGCIDARIFSLLGNVTGSIKTDEDPSGCKVGQTPIPASRRSSSIISCHECFVGCSGTPGVYSSDWKPDYIEEEVK
jgi:hypothetical protein